MKSTTTHRFDSVPRANIQRSAFRRDHGNKLAINAGLLYPFYVDEALPGDTHAVKLSAFGRLATPLRPIMDNLFVETFFFAVPNRLLWDNWVKMCGEQTDPDDTTDYLVPVINNNLAFPREGLHDFMGIPPEETGMQVSALYHRAYVLIWNQWFRDQNLQMSAVEKMDDGPDALVANDVPRPRGKRHDYFTSCLPWPQKGEAVDIPLGGEAPVIGEPGTSRTVNINLADDTPGTLRNEASGNLRWGTSTGLTAGGIIWPESDLNLVADLTAASTVTINQLRESFQIQKMLERDARGGTRYPEVIYSHFGVTHPDQSWRSEYLGGGSSPMNITPIAQTTGSFGTFVGQLAGFGTVNAINHGFTKSFTEHCIIVGIVNIRADLTYQQGLPRKFTRRSRYDFYWPALQGLGEQAVLNSEIYVDGTSVDDDVFGYQERYAEYRYEPSRVSGLFRSSHPQSLDVWHLAQDFGNRPVLNDEFIEEDVPMDRVIAVPSEPDVILDTFMQVNSVRPMPTYGVPGLIDHF